MKQLINLIHSTHLIWVTVGVGLTPKPLEKEKKLGGTCVLLVKGFGVLDSVITWKW